MIKQVQLIHIRNTDSLSDSIAFERNNAAVNPDNRNITDQTLAQKIKKGTTYWLLDTLRTFQKLHIHCQMVKLFL